jgi:dienelactone hydrolase
MQARDIDYRDQAVNLRAYLAWDEAATARRPGVLVFHEGLGLGEFAMARARMSAELGYVALAADMFGDRRQARNLEEVGELLGGLRNEPEWDRLDGRDGRAVDGDRGAACGLGALADLGQQQSAGRRRRRHHRDRRDDDLRHGIHVIPIFPPGPLTFP